MARGVFTHEDIEVEKLEIRVLRVLEEGAATSREVSMELHHPLRNVSAVLSQLRDIGLVKVVGEWSESDSGRKSFIWQLN